MSVVVSGIGLVSPLGASTEKTWERLLNGDSGIQMTPHGLEAFVSELSDVHGESRVGEFALLSAQEACRNAQLDANDLRRLSVGCCVSQSKPVLYGAHSLNQSLDHRLLLGSFMGTTSETLIRDWALLSGPTVNVVAACATGVASIELGKLWIEQGICDLVLVGASESSLNPFYRAGFSQMGVLAEGTTPDAACPFSADRSGFVMGEGASVMVLEDEKSAMKRNHKPVARVLSVALGQTGGDVVRFDPSGHVIAALIQSVCGPQLPDYINAHGTGTLFNDEIETRAIKKAFGTQAMSMAVSSTKAATGHLLGAAGAIEASFCVLSIRDQQIPPTLHLYHPDPLCDLNFVPHQSVRRSVNRALSLSFGFGGQMGAVLFGAYDVV